MKIRFFARRMEAFYFLPTLIGVSKVYNTFSYLEISFCWFNRAFGCQEIQLLDMNRVNAELRDLTTPPNTHDVLDRLENIVIFFGQRRDRFKSDTQTYNALDKCVWQLVEFIERESKAVDKGFRKA